MITPLCPACAERKRKEGRRCTAHESAAEAYSWEHRKPPEDPLEEMARLAEELKLYDLPPEVCVTHKRFIPCRREEGCVFSHDPADITMVREYQSGLSASFMYY